MSMSGLEEEEKRGRGGRRSKGRSLALTHVKNTNCGGDEMVVKGSGLLYIACQTCQITAKNPTQPFFVLKPKQVGRVDTDVLLCVLLERSTLSTVFEHDRSRSVSPSSTRAAEDSTV